MISSQQTKKIIVFSLGGSLIYPSGGLDISFLTSFNKLIRKEVKKGTHVVIVCGGGVLCRTYQQAARKAIGKVPDEDIDWLGIHTTRMHAQLLRTMFVDLAYPKVIHYYDKLDLVDLDKPVVIAAGWKPGWSTDYCATLLAKYFKTRTIVNLSNIEVVYDKDPKKYKDAKPIEKITWQDFETLVGNTWFPGANLPFDPIATRLAKKLGLTVFILKGSNIKNLEKLLDGKPFKGTIIMSLRLDASFFNREYFEMGIGYSGYTTTIYGKAYSHLVNFYRAITIKLFLKPKSFLDVGCGTGLLVWYLRKLGVEAYGMEISKYALSRAYPIIKKYLRFGNVLNLPFKDKSFDMVGSFNVLEHIYKEEIAKALFECNRVCKRFHFHKIFTPGNRWIKTFHKGDLSQVNIASISWWEKLFKKLGFSKAKINFPILPEFMETIFILNKK